MFHFCITYQKLNLLSHKLHVFNVKYNTQFSLDIKL